MYINEKVTRALRRPCIAHHGIIVSGTRMLKSRSWKTVLDLSYAKKTQNKTIESLKKTKTTIMTKF